MHDQLTDRQQQILDFISESINGRGFPPTLRRSASTSASVVDQQGVNDHLKALRRRGSCGGKT
jgi:SOS-response transcriptional repressor LexA